MPSYQSVDVVVSQKDAPHDPVEGVVVRVFSPDGSTLYTSTMTDVSGKASFTLFTQQYSLRFYKFQTSIPQPQVIDVLEGDNGNPPDSPNVFDVVADVVTPASAVDPRLCRASGYFRDLTGAAQRYLDMIFIGEFAPVLVEGAAVLSERRAIRTDDKGFASIDLIRCAIYTATVEGYDGLLRDIRVPDSSSVNLPDLLFPRVQSVSFDPAGPFSVAVGQTLSVTPEVTSSSKVPLTGTGSTDVAWSIEDPTVASLSLTATQLVIRGLKAGTTRLLVRRLDSSVIAIPDDEILGNGTTVTVT